MFVEAVTDGFVLDLLAGPLSASDVEGLIGSSGLGSITGGGS